MSYQLWTHDGARPELPSSAWDRIANERQANAARRGA